MAERGYVDIMHKESGLTSSVLERTVPGWETAGWTRADNGSEESGQQQTEQLPPPPPQQSGENPDDEIEE